MKRCLSEAKKLALQELHLKRHNLTKAKIADALERMASRSTIKIPSNFAWSKVNLAKEAGINISTILAKSEGVYRWIHFINKFEELKSSKESSIRRVVKNKAPTQEDIPPQQDLLELELARQAETICELRSELRYYRLRDHDFKELMRQNSALRSRCQQLEASTNEWGMHKERGQIKP